LRVLRLEVSVYNVYITSQFQTTFAQGVGEGGPLKEVAVNSKVENSEEFVPITSKISASGIIWIFHTGLGFISAFIHFYV
jgi:hypothetical protein